jgi:hypothetical protein
MRFDVAASLAWEEDTDQPMRELAWFAAEDFAEALRVATRLSQETRRNFSLWRAAKNNVTRRGQM